MSETITTGQMAQEMYSKLDELFPGPYKGLNGSYGQSGVYAFADPISWRERAKRILTLVKRLREEGEVHLVSRRKEKPDLWFFVASQKEKKEADLTIPCRVTLAHYGPNPSAGVQVTILVSSRHPHDPLPSKIAYDGKLFTLLPSEPHTYVLDKSVPEARA